MAGPVIGGRRPISWRLAIIVAFVAAYATTRWLEGILKLLGHPDADPALAITAVGA